MYKVREVRVRIGTKNLPISLYNEGFRKFSSGAASNLERIYTRRAKTYNSNWRRYGETS